MFKKSTIDFKSSGVLNKLVFDYLSKNEKLSSYYDFFPEADGFKKLLDTKPYSDLKREKLAELLIQQSQLVANQNENSLQNIHKLKQKNTYTITTGHQLCLFTGPLYFIYKIFSAINLAENLKKKFPAYEFIPVYWMASEDHDFAEVNNFNSGGKNITWKSSQTGAVGDFKTGELKNSFAGLTELFGKSENASYLLTTFENAYLKHENLANATRFLVNELFGKYGLVTIDGNDKGFKEQFKDQFRKDIFDHSPFGLVNDSIEALEKLSYSAQVKPREINCFYIENGIRVRIEKVGDVFNLVGTKRNLTQKELEEIIEKHPEKISPNVVLRPVYQQVVLPNLAYVGGPGELAYWLEFKKMFDSLGVLFPILMPRNFVTVIDKRTKIKIDKLHFTSADVFKSEQKLIKQMQIKENALFVLNKEKENISELYTKITERINQIDKTLAGSVAAELKRAFNGLDRITGKSNRALRRGYEQEIYQISKIKETLFPKNTPQERFENFSSFYLTYGQLFFEKIKENTNPFLLEHIILQED
jgi:bacillithiol synthase